MPNFFLAGIFRLQYKMELVSIAGILANICCSKHLQDLPIAIVIEKIRGCTAPAFYT